MQNMRSSDPAKDRYKWKVYHVSSGHEVTDTRIFRRECLLLKEHGLDVRLMAQHVGPEDLEGIAVDPLPPVGIRWYQRWLLLLPILLKILKGRGHLVHVHDPDLLPIMAVYALLTGKPVVWDAHESFDSVIERTNKLKVRALSSLAAKAYHVLEFSACRAARARVVTVSEPMAERYRKAGIETIVCANYVDHRRIPYPPRVKPVDPPLIINTGNITGVSFEMELLEAFNILRKDVKSRLAFRGDMWPPFRRDLFKRARELGLEHLVECGGPFPWERLVTELIPQGSVAVYIADPAVPQARDGLPNRIFEYWANGLPVIVANDTLCADVVNEVKGGLTVECGNVWGLAEALRTLLTDRKSARELGENGRLAVVEKYAWVKEGVKLIELYDRVLQEAFPGNADHAGGPARDEERVSTPETVLQEQEREGAEAAG